MSNNLFNYMFKITSDAKVVLLVSALTAGIMWVASATQGWGEAWDHTVKGAKLIFHAFVEGVKLYFTTMVNGIMIGINKIKEGWYEFKNAMGIGDESENNKMLAQIHKDTEARKKAITDGAKEVAKLAGQGAKEFALAYNSIKAKPKEEAAKTGIAQPTIPGMAPAGNQTRTSGNEQQSKTNEAIATGGTKTTNITIKIGEIVAFKDSVVNGSKEAAAKTAQAIQDELLRILASASAASS